MTTTCPPQCEAVPLGRTLRRPFRQLTHHAALRMFTRAGGSLGTEWTLHDLRHTAAYRMARDPEVPLADIQWVLGQARLSTTQLYLTPVPDDVIASVAAFHARRACAAPQASQGRDSGYRPETLEVLSGESRERQCPARGGAVVPVHACPAGSLITFIP